MEYDIIPERSSENAKRALALAEERGFEATDVRTFRGGYYVPVKPESEEPDEKAVPKTARKRTSKKE